MRKKIDRKSERGVVFVIVLICLVLLFTIAVLMILSAGTESFLNGNYRASTRTFYAALSGLEEARGRMWPRHPNAFGTFITSAGSPMAVGQVRYVINALSGETVSPTDLSWNNPYADREYQQEFGVPVTSASVQTTTSVSPAGGLDGPLYKWVRITPLTERSLNIDVNNDGTLDGSTPLYFDGTHLNLSSNGQQAFALTALSVLPDRSSKLLQYVITTTPIGLAFPSALTLDGPVGTFGASNDSNYRINGNDQLGGGLFCSPVESPPKFAIGVYRNADLGVVSDAIPGTLQNHYIGSDGTPSVGDVGSSLAPVFQSVSTLDGPNGLVQTITQNADFVVQGPATSLPDYGSSSPKTTVVQGDLSLPGSVDGHGLLLVTGNLTLAGNVRWKGIILVIGQGTLNVPNSGPGEIDGAVFLARTRDSSGKLLSDLGPVSANLSSGGNNGIYYNSCWVKSVQSTFAYKVMSFREIPQ